MAEDRCGYCGGKKVWFLGAAKCVNNCASSRAVELGGRYLQVYRIEAAWSDPQVVPVRAERVSS